MKKKLIILTLFVAVVFAFEQRNNFNTSSQKDLVSLIIQNAVADGEYSSEGCKYKVNYTCWADDGSVWTHCQERVLLPGTCQK